jgi:enamine deaminase RidA (YjgF/YER057c/UK114 family)
VRIASIDAFPVFADGAHRRGRLRERHALHSAARTELFGAHKPADVLLGVTSLSPGYLIEVDAIAIMD